jgi:hypothetical protein
MYLCIVKLTQKIFIYTNNYYQIFTTMKKVILSVLVLAAFVVLPMSVSAQSNATAVGKVTMVTPITLTQVTDLDFGTLASSNTAGEATIAKSSTPALAATGGAKLISATGASAASFTVGGYATQGFSIVVPTTAIPLTGGTSGMSVTLDALTSGTLVAGAATIYVGGTLTVPANATAANYTTANFTVTVAYN